MTLLPPTPPRMDMGNFPYRIDGYTNTTPFTHRDGMTFLRKLESLQHWLMADLVPHVDSSIDMYVKAFNKALGDIQAYMEGQQVIIDDKVADFVVLAKQTSDALKAIVDSARTEFADVVEAAQDAQHDAEAARDLAEQYAATSGNMADLTISQFIANSTSKTREQFNPAAISAVDDFINPAIATIEAFVANDQYGTPYEYEIVRVKAKGQNINKVVEKTYNGYEKSYNPANSFYPPQFFMDDVGKAQGAYIVTNADAVQGTTLPTARVTGVQIKNGVLYAGWGNYDNADPRLGNETLAFMNDGTWRTYRKITTPDAQTIVNDGAHTTYGFGPIVVEAGAVRNYETEFWADWVTTVSARTAIGRAGNGDVIIGLVKGKTGSQGIRGNELGRLMLRHGATDAIMLDGGGSTQGWGNSRYFHPSSDSALRRASSNAILIHVPAYGDVSIGPEAITLNDGWGQAIANGQALVSKDRGFVTYIGTALNDKVSQNTWYPIATVPERYRPPLGKDVRGSGYANGAVTAKGNNGQFQYSISGTTGIIQVKFTGDGGLDDVQGWVDLNAISYKAAY